MDAWWRDIQFATRGLWREPLLATFIMLALALGIGANAAMFGIADRVLLRGPDHVRDADRVMRVYMTERPKGMREFTSAGVGNVSLDLIRNGSRLAESVAGYAENQATAGRGGDAHLAQLGYASANFFPLLGVRPAAGRFFSADENRPAAAEHVVVISYESWQGEFGGANDIVGRTITLNDEPYNIIGVAPRGFTGAELSRVDAWVPLNLVGPHVTPDWRTSWNAQWLKVILRVPNGVAVEQVNRELTAIHRAAYTGDDKAIAEARLSVAGLGADDTGAEPANAAIIRWLAGIALIVLLIASANVVNLLLARGIRRTRDAAIRLALGATRTRIIRLVLIESTLLALGGALLGLGLAAVIGGVARRSLLSDVAWTSPVVDMRVFAMATVLSLAVGLIVGLVPAIGASRIGVAAALKSGVRDGGNHRSTLRASLTVVQAALSVTLLIGAGLFVRSLWNVRTIHLGIDPEQVLVVHVSWTSLATFPAGISRDDERARRGRAFSDAIDQLRRIPQVENASVSVGLPFGNRFTVRLRVPGLDSVPRLKSGGPSVSAVSPDYFATVGTRIVRGHGFTAADRAGTEPVAIVSDLMARTVWPGVDPIGKCIVVGADSVPCARIVGIAEDTHQSELREDPTMHYYIPFGQEVGIGGSVLLVRSSRITPVLRDQLRRTMASLDPTITYIAVGTIQETIDPQLQPWRLGAVVFVASGLLALLVAAVGIYSVLVPGREPPSRDRRAHRARRRTERHPAAGDARQRRDGHPRGRRGFLDCPWRGQIRPAVVVQCLCARSGGLRCGWRHAAAGGGGGSRAPDHPGQPHRSAGGAQDRVTLTQRAIASRGV